MKVEVLQEQLLGGLTIVVRAIAARAQLPALSHVLVEARREGLLLSATDLEIGIRTGVAAKVDQEGRAVVPAKMLLEFLGSLSPGKVELEIVKDALQVKSRGYSAKFQTLSPDEYPAIPVTDKGVVLGVAEAGAFATSVGLVSIAPARDSLRPALTGIQMEFGKSSVRLVGTDGFRLCIEEIGARGGGEAGVYLIPARTLQEVIRVGGEGEITIGKLVEGNQVYFVVGGVEIVSQLIEGNYPDYQKIVPKEFVSQFRVNREELMQAIKAMYIFARENSNMVVWNLTKTTLGMSASSSERGESQVEIPIESTGEEVKIIFNAKYILDYLGASEATEIEIRLAGKLSPGLFCEVGRGGQYIVMPINA